MNNWQTENSLIGLLLGQEFSTNKFKLAKSTVGAKLLDTLRTLLVKVVLEVKTLKYKDTYSTICMQYQGYCH